MKKLILPTFLIFYSTYAVALITTYTPGNSFGQSLQRGNVYTYNNPYNKQNTANPYSTFRSPYHKKSVYQNSARYGARIFSSNGKPVGTISRQFGYGNKTTITNPYNKSGNRFIANQITQPFNKKRNPYSQPASSNPS
ncbi:MAG: hypothetical protein AAGG80_04840, partial [Pseudomonadota bacterium]